MTVSSLLTQWNAIRAAVLISALLCLGLAAGCAGSTEINWEERYNVYSYDNVVKEYGEPTSCADDVNNGRICSWKVDGSFNYRDQMVMKFDAGGRLTQYRQAKIR